MTIGQQEPKKVTKVGGNNKQWTGKPNRWVSTQNKERHGPKNPIVY